MDPGTLNLTTLGSVFSVLTGGIVAALIGLSLAGVSITVRALRRRALWCRLGEELGLQAKVGRASLLATPTLRGIIHGRALEASLLPSGQTRIAVRIANPRHIFDRIHADDLTALGRVLWLDRAQRTSIAALQDPLLRSGSVDVRGNFATLIAPSAGVTDAAYLRGLFVLAQSIAESVDALAGPWNATAPARPRRRATRIRLAAHPRT